MQLKYPSISAQISPDQQIYDGFTLLLQEKTKGLASNAKKKQAMILKKELASK